MAISVEEIHARYGEMIEEHDMDPIYAGISMGYEIDQELTM